MVAVLIDEVPAPGVLDGIPEEYYPHRDRFGVEKDGAAFLILVVIGSVRSLSSGSPKAHDMPRERAVPNEKESVVTPL